MDFENKSYWAGAGIAVVVSWILVTTALPSLRWVPHAFVTGVLGALLAVAYLLVTTSVDPSDTQWRIPPRVVPAFVKSSAWPAEKKLVALRAKYVKRPVFAKFPQLSFQLDSLLDLVTKTFISSWFVHISKKSLFQDSVDGAIRDAIVSIHTRVAELDVAEIAVMRLVPIVTQHMQEFYTAERLVRGKNLTRDITESEELDLAIASKYMNGKLHNAASLAFSDTKLMQQAHIRKVVEGILPLVLSEDMLSSAAVVTLIREIVSCAVLSNILSMLSDPDIWNQVFENFGRSILQDRKNVRKLRAALDEHAPSQKSVKRLEVPRLRPNDNERQFERFIRGLRKLPTIAEARRYRNEITSQIKRGMDTEGQDALYLRRLDAGRRILDQKIALLSAQDAGEGRPKIATQSSSASMTTGNPLAQMSLREVLYNASGMSYFMEFMDRRQRMRLVQFWITVDGFRSPLEEDADDAQPTLQEQMSYTSPDKMDIRRIRDSYLKLPELNVPGTSMQAVDAYIKAGKTADLNLYVKARRAIIRAQAACYEEMREQHFDPFKRSDLFYKWSASEDFPVPQQVSPDRPKEAHSPTELSRPHRPASVVLQRQASANAAVLRREPELRRAVMSSTDLGGVRSKTSLADNLTRRSIDDNGSRPLFGDDIEDERMSQSVPSLAGPESDTDSVQPVDDSTYVVDAMQKELDDIVDGPYQDLTSSDPHLTPLSRTDSPSLGDGQARATGLQGPKPSIASLGLIAATSSNRVFTDDLFADEQEQYPEDEREDPEHGDKPIEDEIKEAAPGDLGLTEAIDALNNDVERLVAQEKIVDSLTKKAELTNNAAELRILRKSKQSLQREIKRKELQKQQYVVQESDNSLYGRASVSIKSIMVGKEEDGHEYAIYVIEVRRSAGDQMPSATWTIARRYSEFHELNKRLKARFEAVRTLEFPRRQALFTLQKDFLQRRRVVLEKYLSSLLLLPAICRSRELRAFLSQSKIIPTNPSGNETDQSDFVTRIYNSVSDGMEEFLGNVPVLDQLTVAGQNLISAASAQIIGNNPGAISATLADSPADAAEAEAEIQAFEDREAEPFVKPISDLFLEAFELQKGNSWLRGRAVVVVLHQLLGGTVERKIRDSVKGATDEASLVRYIDLLKDVMWPGGQLRPPAIPRTVAQRIHSRKEAHLVLASLIPDMAGSVVGRANAQAASRKIAALLNNQRLKYVNAVFNAVWYS